MKKLYNFMKLLWQLGFKKALLSITVIGLMGINRFIILFIPFRQFAPRLGQSQGVATANISRQQIHRLHVISDMIQYFAQRTPWESKCFVQAMTATELLKILKIPSTMYFGLNRHAGDLKAHAWVKVNDFIVTGEGGHEDFQVVAFYGSLVGK